MIAQGNGQFRLNAQTVNAVTRAYDKPAGRSRRIDADAQPGFAQLLDKALQSGAPPLKITKHAESRLSERNIRLTDGQMEKIAAALEKAGKKGVRDALVMLDGLAVVANAKSMTVITAVGEADLRESVFTNIDGAVYA